MVSISCVTSSSAAVQCAELHGRAASSSPSLAAIAFSPDGSRAAYAVRRSQRLPLHGTSEDACAVYVARTRVAAPRGGGGRVAGSPTSSSAAGEAFPSGAIAEFTQWLVTQVLTGGHEAPVTALAWHPRTSALLSVSADRAACVWVPQSNGDDAATAHRFSAVPQLVMLSAEVRLSPTVAAWSMDGAKLYIGTAGGTVAVGRYDVRQRWWICRLVDTAPTPASTDCGLAAARACAVTALVPHPCDNTRVAVTWLDGAVEVRSTYIKSVDRACGAHSHDHDSTSHGGEVGGEAAHAPPPQPFGHVHFSHRFSSWVHDAGWSPSGQQLVVAAHDSTLHVWCWPAESPCPPEHAAVPVRQLPLTRCAFLSESLLAAACFDGFVYVFARGQDAAASSESECAAWRIVPPLTPSATALPLLDAAAVPATATAEARAPASISSTAQVHRRVATHNDPSAAALVEAAPMAKSVRQRARELLERGRAAVAPLRLTNDSHTTTSVGGVGARGAAAEASARRASPPHRAPIHLLVRVPPPVGAPQAESTVVSAGRDDRVHLWRVCSTAASEGE